MPEEILLNIAKELPLPLVLFLGMFLVVRQLARLADKQEEGNQAVVKAFNETIVKLVEGNSNYIKMGTESIAVTRELTVAIHGFLPNLKTDMDERAIKIKEDYTGKLVQIEETHKAIVLSNGKTQEIIDSGLKDVARSVKALNEAIEKCSVDNQKHVKEPVELLIKTVERYIKKLQTKETAKVFLGPESVRNKEEKSQDV